MQEQGKDTRPDAEWFAKVRKAFESGQSEGRMAGLQFSNKLRHYIADSAEGRIRAGEASQDLYSFCQGWSESEKEIGQHAYLHRYSNVLKPFVALMLNELCANSGKGDRPAWLKMKTSDVLLEIFYHAGKLQKALKTHDSNGVIEYSADIANLCLMMVDVCGLLVADEHRPEAVSDEAVPSASIKLLQEREIQLAKDAGQELFLDFPDAWYDPTPTYGCENGHTGERFLKSEALGNVCLSCQKPVFLLPRKYRDEGVLKAELDRLANTTNHVIREVQAIRQQMAEAQALLQSATYIVDKAREIDRQAFGRGIANIDVNLLVGLGKLLEQHDAFLSAVNQPAEDQSDE